MLDQAVCGMRQDVTKGAIELDTCNSVQFHGPVNIMYDPATALPFTQGVIKSVNTDLKKKIYTWGVQARRLLHYALP